MKKFLCVVVFALIFSGCAETDNFINGTTKNEVNEVNEKIRNEKCIVSNKLKVVQPLNDGAISYLCHYGYSSYGCDGEYSLVFLSAKDNDFVDDQKFELPDDKCFMASGRYAYTSKDGRDRVIRKIKVIDANIPNPEYIKNSTKQN